MKVLFVHPSSLMYSKVYLRLEPLGLALVAQSARLAGHEVRILDLGRAPRAEAGGQAGPRARGSQGLAPPRTAV